MKLIMRLAAVTLLCSSTVLGAPNANDLAAYKDAGARLAALIDMAQKRGSIAQLRTAEVTRLVKIISDEGRILRADTYAVTEMGTLLDICDVANKASVSFVLFNLKAHIGPAANQQQIQTATIALANSNTLAFQDELKEIQPFLVRCLAKEVQPMTQFVSALKPAELTDVRRQGLAGARSGLLQIYSGALVAANDARYREDFRLALLAALAETSADFAPVLDLSVRRRMRDSMSAAASGAAERYKLHLTRIADSLSNEVCDGLCAIH
jgi:hypothetical protein